ncbi:lipoprotein NlpI [Pseudidiomarina aestuarii]|uniref:lipoprotein NlpI n=1 Tax=Pseudidiomarina aestuarii TaxID=624146 RepID=UPI003A983F7B
MRSQWGWLLGVLALLQGCALAPTSEQSKILANLMVVTPQQADIRYQLEIAKLNEVLAHDLELDAENKAQLLYRRGSLHDALGLLALARIDFNHALDYDPRLADAYNYLGIHYSQIEEFEFAYEALEAALELDPEHPYAHLNRGVTAYYDGRFDLAVDDFKLFYDRAPEDPYRAIWLYLAELEVDIEAARTHLAQNRVRHGTTEWGWVLTDLMLGVVKEQDFIDRYATRNLGADETMAERMCETYFYLGKLKQQQGEHATAMVYFRLAMSTNVFMFLEHRFAEVEILRSQRAIELKSQRSSASTSA